MNKEIGFWLGVQVAVVIAAGIYGGMAQSGNPTTRPRDAQFVNTIAAQGNAAVRAIRADAREAVRRQPRLELPPAGQQVALSKSPL